MAVFYYPALLVAPLKGAVCPSIRTFLIMDNRKTFKIELTRSELLAIVFALGYVETMEEDSGFISLRVELEELMKNAE